jgi:hypothetical protein
MKKLILSVAILGGLLAFSSDGFAMRPCSTVDDRPRPTQLGWGRWSNCTCRLRLDCDVPVCRLLPQFQRRCDVSPSSFFPDPDQDPTAIPATFLTDPDQDPTAIPATF